MKDFEGNVFIVDADLWKSKPFDGERLQVVRPAFFTNVFDRQGELIEFIENTEHGSGVNAGIENTFVKLFNDHRKQLFEASMALLPEPLPTSEKNRLLGEIKKASDAVSIPSEIIERNSNVSVYRQQEMADYMIKRIKEIGPAELVPVHPLRSEAYLSLLRVIKRIHTYFEKKPKADRSHTFYATLAVKWMDGTTYGQLIEAAYQRAKKASKRGNPGIATVIRGVFDTIEQELRFRYVKYTKCYGDLLQYSLIKTGNEDWLPRIPAIPLYLEMGASSETMLTLMGLGISRASASIVAESAPRTDMSKDQILHWLRQSRLANKLPAVAKMEVESVL